ncbi:MAG: hypothetical protein HC892_00320 [Saprospiraceae bacterium]|nr:hypothetical protein [Saprospiraceae bacterium]
MTPHKKFGKIKEQGTTTYQAGGFMAQFGLQSKVFGAILVCPECGNMEWEQDINGVKYSICLTESCERYGVRTIIGKAVSSEEAKKSGYDPFASADRNYSGKRSNRRFTNEPT